MVNLNDSPQLGRLTEADLDAIMRAKRSPRRKRPYIARGLTEQGRRPDAAEQDDGLGCATGLVYALPAAVAFWIAVAALLWVWS